MAKRQVFRAVPDRKSGKWRVTSGAKTVSSHATQVKAWDAAKKAGRQALKSGGLGQAVLHGRDGVIRTEHTYGGDPRGSKG
jgi:hypothetical protein